MIIIRPAKHSDYESLMRFAKLSGAGFTSLPEDEKILREKLEKSIATFANNQTRKDAAEADAGIYLLMAENVRTKAVVGCAAVKTNIGKDVPFFNFRVVTLGQASKAANRRFDMSTLVMVNDYTGATEVGTLFLDPGHRGEGAGKLLSLSRFMLMAADKSRFAENVVSELRGIVHLDGRSPFWEGVGRPFYRMDFAEADNFSATTDNQFIIDLGPRYPIYVDLLPDSARGAIAETHPDGAPARRLLEREGLRFEGVIDIFDGGPLLSCRLNDTRTIKSSIRMPFKIGKPIGFDKALLSNDCVENFACTLASCVVQEDYVIVSKEALSALNMKEGDCGRVRSFDD